SIPPRIAAATLPGRPRTNPGAGRRHPVLVEGQRDHDGGPQGDRPRPRREGDGDGAWKYRAGRAPYRLDRRDVDQACFTPTHHPLRTLVRFSSDAKPGRGGGRGPGDERGGSRMPPPGGRFAALAPRRPA